MKKLVCVGGSKLLNQYRGELFGIAAILIVIGHSQDFIHAIVPSKIIDLIGYGGVGVTMFAFLLGVGLWQSIDKNENVMKFYKKRGVRVVIPYLLISSIFNLYLYIGVHRSLLQFLLDLTYISYWTEG